MDEMLVALRVKSGTGMAASIRNDPGGVSSISLQQFKEFPVQFVAFEVLVVHI